MQAFHFFFVGGTQFVGHAFLAKTVETGDKNRDDFHCMDWNESRDEYAVNFGNDWNNAQCLSRLSALGKFFLPCKKSRFIFH